MVTISYCLGVVALSLTCCDTQEEAPLCVMPQLEPEWELQADDKRTEKRRAIPYRWCTFKHRANGDLLSFATLQSANDKELLVAKYTDTAFEIFPDGQAVWTSERRVQQIESLFANVKSGRNRGVSTNGVLEYGFIAKRKQLPNLMALGHVWRNSKTIVFLQHTSERPITAEVVRRIVKRYDKALSASPILCDE